MDKDPQKRIWTAPNLLTMLRMLLIGVYLWLFFTERLYWAFAVFVLASLTDALDGYLARKYNLITNFGKLMDPLADKLMICAVLVSLALNGWVPWWLIVLVAIKEFLMILGGLWMLRRGVVVYSGFIGKAATVAFMLAIAATFFHELTAPMDLFLQYTALALTLTALVWYAQQAIAKLKKLPQS